MQEQWRSVVGYEGFYQVSNFGSIRSVARTIVSGGWERRRKSKTIKPRMRNNYLAVNMSRDGVEKTYSVHRIVAESFIENTDGLPQVNHKNGVKTGNSVSNLEWCTASQNQKHASETGLRVAAKGISHPSCKGYVIATNIKTGQKIKMAGDLEFEENGFFSTHVSRCLNGQCESYKGYVFSRVEK